MKHYLLLVAALCCLASHETNAQDTNIDKSKDYQPNWNSLSAHKQSPEWFRDAKFGIYFHWGPYSVPAFGNEHYPRTLYGHPSGKAPKQQANSKFKAAVGFQTFREHSYHEEKYGTPDQFEYHHLFPLFTAEKFDPDAWAQLFKAAGAKFAGPVAIHHDGFAMWDSQITPWNAVNMGPKRDIVGEMAKAIRQQEMKFIATFHHAKAGRPETLDDGPLVTMEQLNKQQLKAVRWWHYFGREQYYARSNPEHKDSFALQKLYGTLPRQQWLEMWNVKLEEVIDQYQPDLIWFDSWLDRIPEKNRQQFAAYYLNAAQQWQKEVVITYKQQDMPNTVGVEDFEKGRLDRLTDYTWLTDDTISAGSWATTGSWSHTEQLEIKPAKELVHGLIDIVSKNGQLLLNISPRADGSIPVEQKQSLLAMGQWLKQNGEAIYGTRPFAVYGEGPKRLLSSGHFVNTVGQYDHSNIRFTRKGDTLYAIQMGVPKKNQTTLIKSINLQQYPQLEINNIQLLGSTDDITWSLTEEGLSIDTADNIPSDIALSFKIQSNGKF